MLPRYIRNSPADGSQSPQRTLPPQLQWGCPPARSWMRTRILPILASISTSRWKWCYRAILGLSWRKRGKILWDRPARGEYGLSIREFPGPSWEGPGRPLKTSCGGTKPKPVAGRAASVAARERLTLHNSNRRLDFCFMREFQLLQHVLATARGHGDVLIPPGDDMAMVRVDGSLFLAAVDQLVEARHVNLETTPVQLVGRKAVTRCLSDVAAMAAQPVASLAAVTFSPNQSEDWATQLFDAINETADLYGCPLIGGDIAVHRQEQSPMVIAVSVLARPGSTPPVQRSGARVGDVVYVTGRLGGSVDDRGLGRHLTFEPRIPEAIELAQYLGARLHAMIDISDGLGRDASHIAQSSGVRVEIDAEAVPAYAGLDWRRAMSDGEDYELCFAAAGEVPDRIADLEITAVGRIVPHDDPQDSTVVVRNGAESFDGSQLGWEHR